MGGTVEPLAKEPRDEPVLRLRTQTVGLSGTPLLMGIVNVSRDSFSDPGRRELPALVDLARHLVAAGAALIDVGGESGRTDRPPISERVEAASVVPVIECLAAEGVFVSVDTWRVPVACRSRRRRRDGQRRERPRRPAPCGSMRRGRSRARHHAHPSPAEAQGLSRLCRCDRGRRLAAAGARGRGAAVRRRAGQILFDPGIDLAKTPAQSIEVLRRLGELRALERPLLLAVSRKDFVGALTRRPPRERLAGTLATIGEAVDGGAAVLRVHDVAAARDYLRVRAALRGESLAPADMGLDEALQREPHEHRGAG